MTSWRIEEQDTQPLPPLNRFQRYLDTYHLTWLQVARAAGVRVMRGWSIAHGRAVTREHASQVRQGLWRLTGVPYFEVIDVFY